MSDALVHDAGGGPVRATTLREGAFHALRRAILAGELAPGARLLETELAARLGVSRNPIREALARLESEGLVRSIPNQGARVVRPQPAQVQDALLVRAQLELLAVRLAMRHPGPARFAPLVPVVVQMRALAAAAAPPDASAYGRMNLLDITFHERLVGCAQSESLQHTWTAAAPLDLIFAHIIAVQLEGAPDEDRLLYDAESHARLLGALQCGDAVRGEAAIKEHFTVPSRSGLVSLDAASAAILGWA